MHNCPASPNCPYCDDDGEHERLREEADEEARREAFARDGEEDDLAPIGEEYANA